MNKKDWERLENRHKYLLDRRNELWKKSEGLNESAKDDELRATLEEMHDYNMKIQEINKIKYILKEKEALCTD